MVPAVGKIEPEDARPRSSLAISGSGFGDQANDLVAKIGDVEMPVQLLGADTLTLVLPPQLAAGTYQVIVTNRATARSSGPAALRVLDVVTIPAGTELRVRTGVALSSKRSATGQRFPLTVSEPLVVEGRQIAAAGSRATGRITHAHQPGRVKGVAELGFTLVELEVLEGTRALELVTANYNKRAQPTRKRDAAMVGGGAAAGAVVGALIGGKKGALIGAGAGGAAGTGTALATRGKQIELPAGSEFTFTLREPLELEIPPVTVASGR
ncbi:MAG: IPT/TIG domain-containing protein [Candidatus Latescibacterota bacterium]